VGLTEWSPSRPRTAQRSTARHAGRERCAQPVTRSTRRRTPQGRTAPGRRRLHRDRRA
jgi:hypothetical protein